MFENIVFLWSYAPADGGLILTMVPESDIPQCGDGLDWTHHVDVPRTFRAETGTFQDVVGVMVQGTGAVCQVFIPRRHVPHFEATADLLRQMIAGILKAHNARKAPRLDFGPEIERTSERTGRYTVCIDWTDYSAQLPIPGVP